MLAAGGERGGGDRLYIYIRFAGANEPERLGLVLRHLVGVVAEEHLHGHSGNGAGAVVAIWPSR